MTTDPRERLIDLLAAEATEGLSDAEANELRGLLTMFPDTDPDALARVAAAADLAMSEDDPMPPLPPHLAAQLERQGLAMLGHESAPEPSSYAPRVSPPRSARMTLYLGWAVAAGIAALFLYMQFKPAPDTTDRRNQLLKDQAAAVRTFEGQKGGAAATIVWSGAKQEGYLEVRGLPPLDPTKEQYQLWIVDGGRSPKFPVDGGVFDVRPDGTALVPITAKLTIRDAAAFAVTREAAGGVVVTEKKPEEWSLVLQPKQG